MDPNARPLRWPALLVRGVGLWILLGAGLKLFLGTPADLPQVVRDLPLAAGLAYQLAIGVELFVALLALARPARGWLTAALLLLLFVGVLVTQIAAGAESCGCLGQRIKIPPGWMLAVDGVWLVLLLASRPWRLRGDWAFDLIFAVGALVVAAALPILFDREAAGGDLGGPGLRRWVDLDVESWVGRPVGETELARWTDVSHARDGLWFLWRRTCPVCAECLAHLAESEHGARDLTLVELREPPDPEVPVEVHTIPEGPWVFRLELPDTVTWVLTAPAELVVVDGKVASARKAMTPEDCASR
jgi:hypothetical protein